MKKQIILLLLTVITLASFAQDAKNILQKSYSKCQSIKNGYYELTSYSRFFDDTITYSSNSNCSFKKLANDSISPCLYHIYSYTNPFKYSYDNRYTGEELVMCQFYDSIGTIYSNSVLKNDEHDIVKIQSGLFLPFIFKNAFPINKFLKYIDNSSLYKLKADEKINNVLCYHIQLNIPPSNEPDDFAIELNNEYHIWINKTDFIPMQYSITLDRIMNNDSVTQYDKLVLNKYELNNLKDESGFEFKTIPNYITLKNYMKCKGPAALAKDSLAPDWSLMSTTDEEVRLKDLRGKLVLIDFFYKSCYPCRLALPALQALNEKYKDKGLKVIGIDPYDKKDNEIIKFLHKSGVNYTVLFDNKDVIDDYHVSGFPTMYLIDKTGKIIYTQVGYSKEVDEKLEEIIKKNL